MDANIQKALNDKLYDKRKSGALELEATVREALASDDHEKISKIITQLCQEYAYAVHQPHARNGGLIGLAAASIALGSEVARYLAEIVPPVLACFSDHDARVRYYACESMYNIAKVAKGEILVYFNEVFDALCKLTADSELSVKNGSELLDRLIKDIVSESAATYVSTLQIPEGAATDTDSVNKEGAPSLELPTAFSLARFIPLLKERIFVINPFTRTFLVSWITLLDSIPDLELVSYLPSFLGGLFRFLSDPNQDVHTATQTALERFLNEIKKIARVKRGIAESRKSQGEDLKLSSSSLRSDKSSESGDSVSSDNQSSRAEATGDSALHDGSSLETESITANDEKSGSDGDWIPGQDVQVDHAKILDILVTFLSDSTEEEIQLTALRWIDSFFEICSEDILLFVPRLLSHVLPAMSNDVEQVRRAANGVNTSLMEYIMSLPDEAPKPGSLSPVSTHHQVLSTIPTSTARDPLPESRRESNISLRASRPGLKETAREARTPEPPKELEARAATPADDRAPSPRQVTDLDYEAAVSSLTLQFLNEHEATRVAALTWLIMLHRKAPRKLLAINDGTFPALLKTLSDPSESVVTRDLSLLSQISRNSDDSYFASFMINLLKLFATDRRLLESRGNLIIRHLCVSLSAERIYRTLADCLEKDEDVEFASIMVQNLNNNLITAPELADLRKRLRNLETRDGQAFFVTLFRSWCHNAVATFSLCLLAQAYEQAYNLLQIFGELEMTVNMLIQIDKLVQLLESPVFTYLRLQLLEPEKFPYLYKCLYGLLMLLPQSAAFAALKNRLNSVSAIGFLHFAGQGPPRTYVSSTVSSLYHSRQKSSESGLPSSSVATSSSVSSFERPNRLKAREEGGIRWGELLEKFKSTQDRARRAQRLAMQGEDGVTPLPSEKKAERPAAHQQENQGKAGASRPGSAAAGNLAAGRSTTPVAASAVHSRTKSSLGRLTGGIGARKTKR